MRKERKQGIMVSTALHSLMLLLMVFGLPSWLLPPPPPEVGAISVELLPISELTNVKPADKVSPEKPAEKPPEPKAEPEKPKPPAPPVKAAEPPPPPPKKEEILPPKDEKKPEVKKEEPKKEEPKNKAKEEDLDAVLKAIKKTVNDEKKKADDKAAKDKKAEDDKKKADAEASEAKSTSTNYDASMPMSLSEKDAIRSQFARCWSMPAGAKNAHELVVPLKIEVAMDGTVTKVELASEGKARYSSDAFYRAAADSAIRAVHQCSPLKNLPPEKYGTWREMDVYFDPKEMLF